MKNEMKKGILGGIISSVIVMIFINPILGFIWVFLGTWFSSYIDSLYFNAALGQRNWIDLMSFIFILFIIQMFMTTKFKEIFFRNEKTFKKIKNLTDYNEIIDNNNLKITRLEEKIKILKFITIGLYPISLIFLFNVVFKAYSDLQLNTSFNQRLTIIAPYIDQTEEELIKSDWSLMKKKDDFIKIDKRIENIAKKNKIILPENLLE